MALVLADRVQETTTTTGTGTVTLLGAVTGYQSFAVVGNANTTYYCIAGQTGAEWEVGIGTYTSAGTTLARTTVLASSNAGSLVNFSAGTKNVFVTYPAGYTVNTQTGAATSVANAVTFNSSGGAAAGTTYNGSVARTIDYSSVGAPSTTGTGASGSWGISVTGSSASCTGNAATATTATTANGLNSANSYTAVSFTATSDERLKTNWRPMTADFLVQLAKVKHGTFDRIDMAVTQDGVSAQSLQPVLPNSVHKDAEGRLSVNYGNAALVSAIELAQRVVEQEARIAKLESLVAQLTKGNSP